MWGPGTGVAPLGVLCAPLVVPALLTIVGPSLVSCLQQGTPWVYELRSCSVG